MRLILTFSIIATCAMYGNEWSRLRGNNGSGIAKGSKPPIKLDLNNPTWKTPVSTGHSSPVLFNKLIFLTGTEDGQLTTYAFSKTSGELAWQRKLPKVDLERVHQANSPAAPTPITDDKHIFVYFGSFGMVCYDHTGKERWQKRLPVPRTLYGTSSSPIEYNDLIILVIDDDNNLPRSRLSRSKIIALNKSDGSIAWETQRPFHRSGWSTPTLWNHGKETELVVLGNGRLCGYALPSGQEKWFVTGFSRETISAPITGNGMAFASASRRGGGGSLEIDPQPFWKSVIHYDSNGDQKLERSEMIGHFTFPFRPELPYGHPGYGMPLPKDKNQRSRRLDGIFGWMDKNRDGFWSEKEFIKNFSHGSGKPMLIAVKPGGKGDITESHLAWEHNRGIAEIPSPLFYENRIYMVRSGGILTALNANTGNRLYSERLGASGQYSASPVLANDHLYLASEPGVISVVKADDEMKIVDQQKLGEKIFVSPALDANTIYIRSTKHLWAFRKN